MRRKTQKLKAASYYQTAPVRGRFIVFLSVILIASLCFSSSCGRKEENPGLEPEVEPKPKPVVTAPDSPYAKYQKIGLSPRPAKFYRRWE